MKDPRSVLSSEELEDRRAAILGGVAGRICKLIEEAGLGRGDRLPPERALAASLGVSRNSVREGLTVLRVVGLVEIRHGDGIRMIREIDDVIPPIAADAVSAHPQLPALGEVRNHLEALAASLAAARRTDRDLGAMAAALTTMDEELGDGRPGLDGDRAFHDAVLAAAHNPVLSSVMRTLADGASQIASASLSRAGQPERSLATHRLIFEAIAVRDADEASRLMRDHLTITGEIEPPAG